MPARVLITGGAGQLARACAAAFEQQGWEVLARSRSELDVTDPAAVTDAVGAAAPAAVVHTAAWTDVDGCEADPARADRMNHLAVGHVARACEEAGAHLCHISTDYVFDGQQRVPYTETDRPNPQSAYGRSKLAGEETVGAEATVVRTSWLSGRHGGNIVRTVLRLASDRTRPLPFVDDQRGSPTVAEDLAVLLERLVAERRPGMYHVTNTGDATWYELARHVLAKSGHDPPRVQPVRTSDLDPPRPASRPAYSVLDNAALRAAGIPPLRAWREAVSDLVRDLVRET